MLYVPVPTGRARDGDSNSRLDKVRGQSATDSLSRWF